MDCDLKIGEEIIGEEVKIGEEFGKEGTSHPFR